MIKIVNNIAIAAVSISSLSSCAKGYNTDMANKAKIDLVGMTKLELYECAGLPVKNDVVEGVEFLSYISSNLKSSDGTIKQDFCEATFIIKDGKVSKLTYNSQEGYLDTQMGFISRQCSRIVENCI